MSIEQRVKTLIAQQLGVDEAEVKSDARFGADLGCDSLDAVELIIAAEEEFDIDVPDEDVEKIVTVQDAIDCVERTITAKEGDGL